MPPAMILSHTGIGDDPLNWAPAPVSTEKVLDDVGIIGAVDSKGRPLIDWH